MSTTDPAPTGPAEPIGTQVSDAMHRGDYVVLNPDSGDDFLLAAVSLVNPSRVVSVRLQYLDNEEIELVILP